MYIKLQCKSKSKTKQSLLCKTSKKTKTEKAEKYTSFAASIQPTKCDCLDEFWLANSVVHKHNPIELHEMDLQQLTKKAHKHTIVFQNEIPIAKIKKGQKETTSKMIMSICEKINKLKLKMENKLK